MKKLIILILSMFLIGCTESFNIESNDFESVIVIEATITDEFKHQEILISNAYKIDQDIPSPLTNAIIKVVDQNNISYLFTESEPGKYISNNPFKAIINVGYSLEVTTEKGEIYTSTQTKIKSKSTIDNLTVSFEPNLNEFSINVNSYNPNSNSNYYKFSYQETYKIIAPYWSPLDIEIIDRLRNIVKVINKPNSNTKICYQTVNSNQIIQTKTTDLNEDRLTNFPVRKISANDFIVSHRYSINVKQQVQSFDAYTYYSVLKKFSNVENILSQNQPGFFNGNIKSASNPNNKVLGFFEVASVSSKRLFFNYRDYISSGRPDFPETCYTIAPELQHGFSEPPGPLIRALESNSWVFNAVNKNISDSKPGPYLIVQKGCGYCTSYGRSSKPNFWID